MSRQNSREAKAQRRTERAGDALCDKLTSVLSGDVELREMFKGRFFYESDCDSDSPHQWVNDRYLNCDSVCLYADAEYRVTVFAYRSGQIRLLIITPLNGTCPDWAQKQAIKNEIAGEEAWAYELYPAESSLIDSGAANYWLWVIDPGEEEFFTPMTGTRITPDRAAELARRYGQQSP